MEDFVEKCVDMKLKFLSQGYPQVWVEQAYALALEKSHSDLLSKNQKRQTIFSYMNHYLFSSKSSYKISIYETLAHLKIRPRVVSNV